MASLSTYQRTLEDAYPLAVSIAGQAAEMIAGGVETMLVEYKEDGSEVTNVDIAVNGLVGERINGRFANHGLIGEE